VSDANGEQIRKAAQQSVVPLLRDRQGALAKHVAAPLLSIAQKMLQQAAIAKDQVSSLHLLTLLKSILPFLPLPVRPYSFSQIIRMRAVAVRD
jgi:hypothetical protein